MFTTTAFFIGTITTALLFIYNSIFWILMSLSNIRIEKVGFGFPKIYTLVVNKVAIELGLINLGGFVRPSGMLDESLDESGQSAPLPYEFRSHSKLRQFLFLLSAPLSFLIAGSLFIMVTGCLSLDDLSVYVSIAFFQEPMEYGAALWERICTDRLTLFGFYVFILGMLNILVSNVWLLFLGEKRLELLIFIPYLIALTCYTPLLRLVWANFSVDNLLTFFVGTLLIYLLIIPLNVLLAKILPNA